MPGAAADPAGWAAFAATVVPATASSAAEEANPMTIRRTLRRSLFRSAVSIRRVT
jgi:hypothetical protein